MVDRQHQRKRPQRLQIGQALPVGQEEGRSRAPVEVRDGSPRRPLQDRVALRNRLPRRRGERDEAGEGIALPGAAVAEVDPLSGRAVVEVGGTPPSRRRVEVVSSTSL